MKSKNNEEILRSLEQKTDVQSIAGITISRENLAYSVLEQGDSLLYYDQTSSDEEILGESLNMQYQKDTKQFIPCNKTHKIFTVQENIYRKKFYEETQGFTNNGELYSQYYDKIEKNIFSKQKEIKQRKTKFKQELKRHEYTHPKDIQDLKEREDYIDRKKDIVICLEEAIGSPKILKVEKSIEQPNGVYPNFAIAQIDYIQNNKLFSKLCEEVKSDGHSERQIFDYTFKVISKDSKLKGSECIILNMHTTLSMCNTCYDDAETLITKVKELTQKDNFKINVSYKFPYFSSPKQNLQKGLFQKQIEISDVTQHHQTIFDNIVPSSGYTSSPEHKAAIERLSPKKKEKKDINVFDISKPSCSKDLFNDHYEDLLQKLKNNDNTLASVLNLRSMYLVKQKYQELGEILMQYNPDITELNVSNNNLGQDAVNIAPLIKLPKIKILNLINNHLKSAWPEDLASAIINSNISTLYLHHNNLGVQGVKNIIPSILCSKITTLSLYNNKIGADGIQALAGVIQKSNLLSLDIRDNNIGDAGAKCLANALPHSKIISLDMRSNNIEDVGAQAIANALPKSNIMSLKLSFNNIGNVGAQAMVKQIPNSYITILNLGLGNNPLKPVVKELVTKNKEHISKNEDIIHKLHQDYQEIEGAGEIINLLGVDINCNS